VANGIPATWRRWCRTAASAATATADQWRADALLTYANLTAPSTANAAQTFAQRALMRMQGSPSQMPPLPNTAASAAEMTR